MEMKKWASKVKRTIKGEGRGSRKSINLAIVSSANNHYAGFGLEEEDDKSYLDSNSSIQGPKQSTISDFTT